MNMLISRLKDDEVIISVDLKVKQGAQEREYPDEFTIPIVGNEVELKIISTELIGEVKESEWKKLNK